MGSPLNLMALVVFATSLFTRSIDPIIPQIAGGLNVSTTTAALLSTGFTLPYALIQPVLGALADMLSKTRLIIACMIVLGVATLLCGLATNFEMLMTFRIIAGAAGGGVFPIAFAVVGDRVPVAQRQVAIGRILAAAMSGNLLGATAAGVMAIWSTGAAYSLRLVLSI
jgi:predicted MFS family arabinose efflux permease